MATASGSRMRGFGSQRFFRGGRALVFLFLATAHCLGTTGVGDATSEAAGGPTSETCAGSRTLRFFPERTGEEDEKRPPRVDVHYGRARGLKGSENSLKVEIPAIRGAGYVLVVLDIYSGLDIPEDLGFEIRSKLGGRTAVDDAEDGRIGGTDEKKEEEKNVLFQKILREPTVKFGLTATAPEGIRVPSTKKAVGSQHVYVSELTAEKAGDFTVAYASVRPWNLKDSPQVYFALVHFD